MNTLNTVPANLDTRFLDTFTPEGYCPGFAVWEVLATDGNKYFMASDHEGGLGTRIYLRTNGKVDKVSATRLGENLDAIEWCKLRDMSY